MTKGILQPYSWVASLLGRVSNYAVLDKPASEKKVLKPMPHPGSVGHVCLYL